MKNKKPGIQTTKKMLVRIIVLSLIILTTSCRQRVGLREPRVPVHQADSKKISSPHTQGAGTDTSQLIGLWVQPNPINANEVQGFDLKKGGTAESINMATLKYKSWLYVADTLTLVVESIGNKTSSVDTLKYQVTKITDKELELKRGQIIERYKKQ